MKHITVDIPDEKYSFFLELIKGLGFRAQPVKESLSTTDGEVLASLKQGFKELEMAKAGTLETRSLKDFLDEI